MFTLLLGVLVAATPSPPPSVDAVAHAFVDDGAAVGVVVGLVTPDSVWVQGFGRVSEDEDRAPDGETVFDVARLTGRITGMLVFDAIHAGSMSLEHPINRYFQQSVTVPSGPHEPIRLGDLVFGTSGLPDLPPSLAVAPSPALWSLYGLSDLHRDLATVELEFEPGERSQPSLFADAVLGVCLDRASTLPLHELLRERITSRLGLTSTGFDPPAGILERAAGRYDAQKQPCGRVRPDALRPATGLSSSAHDLTRLLQALLQAADSPWIEMCHYWWTVLGEPQGLKARDWADFPEGFVASDVYVGLGSASALLWEPRNDRAVLVLSNTATAEIGGLAREAFDAWRNPSR